MAPAATNTHATIEELLEAMFSMQCMSRLRSEDEWEKLVMSQNLMVESQRSELALNPDLHC
jgi:uncharacterized protein (DUF1697 family)